MLYAYTICLRQGRSQGSILQTKSSRPPVPPLAPDFEVLVPRIPRGELASWLQLNKEVNTHPHLGIEGPPSKVRTPNVNVGYTGCRSAGDV